MWIGVVRLHFPWRAAITGRFRHGFLISGREAQLAPVRSLGNVLSEYGVRWICGDELHADLGGPAIVG